jgi:hypothetical protein
MTEMRTRPGLDDETPAVEPASFAPRPRVVAIAVVVLAVAALLPWVGSLQWRGEGVVNVALVRGGRPFAEPSHAGYLILGMAAESLLPGRTSADLNHFSLILAVLATLAVARLRSVLARGGVPLDRMLEPMAAAFALLSAGPWVVRALSADPTATATLLSVVAVTWAWTGRLARAAWTWVLLVLIASRAVLLLPLILLAPRVRGDIRTALLPMALIGIYLAVVRPGLAPAGDPAGPPSVADDLLRLLVGMGGLLIMALVGSGVALKRGSLHRRFAAAVGASFMLHALLLIPKVGLVEALTPLVPWWAVLAGGGVASLGRAFGRARRLVLAPAGAGLGLLVLAAGLWLAHRHQVAPTFRRAEHNTDFMRGTAVALSRPYRLAGGWEDLRFLDQALDFRVRPWELMQPVIPLPDRVLSDRARAVIDSCLHHEDVLLLRRASQAVPLIADTRGLAQVIKVEAPPPGPVYGPSPKPEAANAAEATNAAGTATSSWTGGLATFGSALALERIECVLPPDRAPGGLISLRFLWQARWPPGGEPAEAAGRPLRVATRIVDASGRVAVDLTHWLAHGLVPVAELGGQRFEEIVVGAVPADSGPGDYGVEVAVYWPLPGEAAALELDLGHGREHHLKVVTAGIPPGVTPQSARTASFRLEARDSPR